MRIITLGDRSMENTPADMLKRDPNNYDSYTQTVEAIVNDVRNRRDEAVFEYTARLDHACLDASGIRMMEAEIQEVMEQADARLLDVMKQSMENIRSYHGKQKRNSWFDAKPDRIILGQKVTVLESMSVYVLGGKAAYLSPVLMNTIPAEVAGVKQIVTVTPPGKDGKVNLVILTAAHLVGATQVCKMGGAQAVAALAFGTQSIPRVDKIVGPGNIFVALVKKAVYDHVSVDSIAGPSEILVIADDSANPWFVAADLLSQIGHDELISVILVITNMDLTKEVLLEMEGFLKVLPRGGIISKSLDNYGYILVAGSMEKTVEASNSIVPERLEIVTRNPFKVMTKIQNAGAIFIGEYSSEPLGDYFAGPNHILPTNSMAKFFSPLGVDDFIKKLSIIYYSREALEKAHKEIGLFAGAEHLTAHANSIRVRFE